MPYTAEPARYDTVAIVGDTMRLDLRLEDEAGDPISLVGATGTASVRTEPGGEQVLAPTVTITDAEQGELRVSAPASATVGIVPGIYRYAVRLTWPDSTVRTVLEGLLTARRVAVG